MIDEDQMIRSAMDIRHAIESLKADIDKWSNFLKESVHWNSEGITHEDMKSIIRSCTYRINTLKWVLLERTTWL